MMDINGLRRWTSDRERQSIWLAWETGETCWKVARGWKVISWRCFSLDHSYLWLPQWQHWAHQVSLHWGWVCQLNPQIFLKECCLTNTDELCFGGGFCTDTDVFCWLWHDRDKNQKQTNVDVVFCWLTREQCNTICLYPRCWQEQSTPPLRWWLPLCFTSLSCILSHFSLSVLIASCLFQWLSITWLLYCICFVWEIQSSVFFTNGCAYMDMCSHYIYYI